LSREENVRLELNKIRRIVNNALREDIGKGDITTDLLVPETRRVKAKIVTREPGVVAGIGVAEEVFKAVEGLLTRKEGGKERKRKGIEFKKMIKDGDLVKKGETLAEIRGSAQVVLTGERTALNFLQHLSGIATLTRKYVEAVISSSPQGKVKIYDTRKTLPGLRYLEKYAVRCGGGYNHRMGLYDMVLIKDNHWYITQGGTRGRVASGWNLEEIKRKIPQGMKVEVEVDNLRQLKRVLTMDVDIVMLDNMKFPVLNRAVRLVQVARNRKTARSPAIEVSGKINLESIKQIAHLGVDRISVGEITHSVRALDISLEIVA
jgi:nicotinate-nucleotide pyrophosphorylase (carboxylating)